MSTTAVDTLPRFSEPKPRTRAAEWCESAASFDMRQKTKLERKKFPDENKDTVLQQAILRKVPTLAGVSQHHRVARS